MLRRRRPRDQPAAGHGARRAERRRQDDADQDDPRPHAAGRRRDLCDRRAAIGADDSYRRGIGYMPQIARFPENLTARELIAMLTDLRGSGHAGGRRADRALRARRRTRQAASRALGRHAAEGQRRPRVPLPARAADPRRADRGARPGRRAASSRTRSAPRRRQGKTLILTSHVMSELEELADDVAFLIEGESRFAGPCTSSSASPRQPNLERAIARHDDARSGVHEARRQRVAGYEMRDVSAAAGSSATRSSSSSSPTRCSLRRRRREGAAQPRERRASS